MKHLSELKMLFSLLKNSTHLWNYIFNTLLFLSPKIRNDVDKIKTDAEIILAIAILSLLTIIKFLIHKINSSFFFFGFVNCFNLL